MTQKIHGAAYPGVWVERKVAFVKLTFDADIANMAAAHLSLLGTTQVCSAGTVGSSVFGVVESALVQALKALETKSTVLAISEYDATHFSVDVMLGNAEGWFSDTNGAIVGSDGVTLLGPITVLNAQAVVKTEGAAGAGFAALGTVVAVDTAYAFSMEYVYMDGNMPLGTFANGALMDGPGASSGAFPMNSSTGTRGFYPKTV
jgi:hypothetical protein